MATHGTDPPGSRHDARELADPGGSGSIEWWHELIDDPADERPAPEDHNDPDPPPDAS